MNCYLYNLISDSSTHVGEISDRVLQKLVNDIEVLIPQHLRKERYTMTFTLVTRYE